MLGPLGLVPVADDPRGRLPLRAVAVHGRREDLAHVLRPGLLCARTPSGEVIGRAVGRLHAGRAMKADPR